LRSAGGVVREPRERTIAIGAIEWLCQAGQPGRARPEPGEKRKKDGRGQSSVTYVERDGFADDTLALVRDFRHEYGGHFGVGVAAGLEEARGDAVRVACLAPLQRGLGGAGEKRWLGRRTARQHRSEASTSHRLMLATAISQ
jgi:hypothetical protein